MSPDCPMIMLITNKLHDSPVGGRELLCKLNHDALQDLYGDCLILFELPSERPVGLQAVINASKGHIDGLSQPVFNKAFKIIKDNNVNKIFVDGSNLGAFVEIVKSRFPNIEVSTFCHNVEARFFWGAFKQSKSLRALAVFFVNYLTERKGIHYSDKIICLNKRDGRLLKNFYGRGATHIAPMALQDKLPLGHSAICAPTKEKYALFVGGTFYANRQGIEWFVEHVAQKSPIKTYVVGKGFEKLKMKLERNGNVEVVGRVDNLVSWYLGAHVVIAPIFDGSGMKTKVAEALMFGRRVIGTPEAFAGYEEHVADVGIVCRNAADFISAIGCELHRSVSADSAELRGIYENNYSFDAARRRMGQIIDDSYPPMHGDAYEI